MANIATSGGGRKQKGQGLTMNANAPVQPFMVTPDANMLAIAGHNLSGAGGSFASPTPVSTTPNRPPVSTTPNRPRGRTAQATQTGADIWRDTNEQPNHMFSSAPVGNAPAARAAVSGAAFGNAAASAFNKEANALSGSSTIKKGTPAIKPVQPVKRATK